MSLKRPTQKMSKSDPDPKSRILITDTYEEIHAKIKGAITDSTPGISYDPEKRPGVSNLIDILRNVMSTGETSTAIAKDLQHMTMRALKEMVADSVATCLLGIRENFLELMEPGNKTLYDEAYEGARKAQRKAAGTMRTVRHSLGLNTLVRRTDLGGTDEAEDTDADVDDLDTDSAQPDATPKDAQKRVEAIEPDSTSEDAQKRKQAIEQALQRVTRAFSRS